VKCVAQSLLITPYRLRNVVPLDHETVFLRFSVEDFRALAMQMYFSQFNNVGNFVESLNVTEIFNIKSVHLDFTPKQFHLVKINLVCLVT